MDFYLFVTFLWIQAKGAGHAGDIVYNVSVAMRNWSDKPAIDD